MVVHVEFSTKTPAIMIQTFRRMKRNKWSSLLYFCAVLLLFVILKYLQKLSKTDVPHLPIDKPAAPTLRGQLDAVKDASIQTHLRSPPYNTSGPKPNYNVHVFYYAWYKNLDKDGKWYHWDHRLMNHYDQREDYKFPHGRHEPPDDVGANFYPMLGAYSSADPDIIHQHMNMIRSSTIGTI